MPQPVALHGLGPAREVQQTLVSAAVEADQGGQLSPDLPVLPHVLRRDLPGHEQGLHRVLPLAEPDLSPPEVNVVVRSALGR